MADADPIDVGGTDTGEDNLLGELARAMHAAATGQYQRLNADLERRRTDQVEEIDGRTTAESDRLRSDSETDIGAIDAWAKTETEKIKLERLRRIDSRREELAGQLAREETIKQREISAVESALDLHRAEVDHVFGRMERESDPAAIARVAAAMPPIPALADVAEEARRAALAEFDGVVEPTEASGVTDVEPIEGDSQAPVADVEAQAEVIDGEPETSAEAPLKGVMDPAAVAGETDPSEAWEAPYAVSVAAGHGGAEEDPSPATVGSTLLRTVRSIRPMAGRHERAGDEGDTTH